ncbi:uncharacterized protein LOC121407006 [Lytechinus variegatus]|uniref:uncharacterized protein LOC121407006 n=1 Tax=Lytechinus variegatus TaxID=7654 RepID=UPI001BB29A58|nr:uncharacterized protein LOC121407006 [Lytechinus variegatus]
MGDKPGSAKSKGKFFELRVKLFTDEIFVMKEVYQEMKIRALKSKMEFITGIPSHLQRLTYLDEADMMDDSDVKHHDIVPGAIINLDVWNTWKSLISAAAKGDVNQVMKLGVTKDTTYETPSSKTMREKSRQAWIADRAFVALCIAAHRGHVNMVQKLIEGGSDVHAKTANGRTALHIAAAQGMNSAVEVLLHNGATIDDPDCENKSPLVLAGVWGHKSCERQIFLYQWQQRAAKQKPIARSSGRMAHQMYDSKLKTWYTGAYAQMYATQILPPGEFSGTRLNAPRRKHRPQSASSGWSSDGEIDDDDWLVDQDEVGTQVKLGMETLKNVQEAEARAAGKKGSKTDKGKGGVKDRNSTFEDWLSRKQNNEREKMKGKKKADARSKMLAEDKKRSNAGKEPPKQRYGLNPKSPEMTTPDDGSFDMMKLRKEMNIFNPIEIKN